MRSNAALDKAMALGVEWIAFIDDDEVAAPDWIAGLMAAKYLDTPILLGAIMTEYPDPAPFWVTAQRRQAGVPLARLALTQSRRLFRMERRRRPLVSAIIRPWARL